MKGETVRVRLVQNPLAWLPTPENPAVPFDLNLRIKRLTENAAKLIVKVSVVNQPSTTFDLTECPVNEYCERSETLTLDYSGTSPAQGEATLENIQDAQVTLNPNDIIEVLDGAQATYTYNTVDFARGPGIYMNVTNYRITVNVAGSAKVYRRPSTVSKVSGYVYLTATDANNTVLDEARFGITLPTRIHDIRPSVAEVSGTVG